MAKKLVCIIGVGLLVVAVVVATTTRLRPEPISLEKYSRILDEITSVKFGIRFVTPDHSGATLAYVHAAEFGRGLSLVDLKTLEQRLIPLANEVTQVYGWSHDDRYLVFLQTVSPPGKDAWLTVLERASQSVRRLTTNEQIVESSFTWLTNATYFFVSKPLKGGKEETFWGDLSSGVFNKASIYLREDKFVGVSEKQAAFAYTANIYTFDVIPVEELRPDQKPPKIQRLTSFSTNDFDSLQWLRYSRETGRYLFCARPTNSTWRCLFQYAPRDGKVTQFSHEDTYNGQWLQQGLGFAYVINTNNSFHLAVRPHEPADCTNLFREGSVLNYTVAPSGNVIYASAAQGAEPHGIWEYSLTNRRLRQVASGMGKPFASAQVVAPHAFKLKSFDGLEIPCFLVAPPGQAGASGAGRFLSLRREAKYPAVIYVPPTSSQFQRAFDERAQLLANAGFYFLAVNYRGCDGYGSEFSRLGNTPDATKDILQAYRYLLKNHAVDERNVFLCTISGGDGVVFELVTTASGLWRAVAMDKPSSCPPGDRFAGRKLPPMLIITADQDPAFPSVMQFVSWASSNEAEVGLVVHTNATHFTYKLDERRDKLDQVAGFFLGHVKK